MSIFCLLSRESIINNCSDRFETICRQGVRKASCTFLYLELIKVLTMQSSGLTNKLFAGMVYKNCGRLYSAKYLFWEI